MSLAMRPNEVNTEVQYDCKVRHQAVIKVDDFERLITMQDGTKIPMDDILSIDGELFLSLE